MFIKQYISQNSIRKKEKSKFINCNASFKTLYGNKEDKKIETEKNQENNSTIFNIIYNSFILKNDN